MCLDHFAAHSLQIATRLIALLQMMTMIDQDIIGMDGSGGFRALCLRFHLFHKAASKVSTRILGMLTALNITEPINLLRPLFSYRLNPLE